MPPQQWEEDDFPGDSENWEVVVSDSIADARPCDHTAESTPGDIHEAGLRAGVSGERLEDVSVDSCQTQYQDSRLQDDALHLQDDFQEDARAGGQREGEKWGQNATQAGFSSMELGERSGMDWQEHCDNMLRAGEDAGSESVLECRSSCARGMVASEQYGRGSEQAEMAATSSYEDCAHGGHVNQTEAGKASQQFLQGAPSMNSSSKNGLAIEVSMRMLPSQDVGACRQPFVEECEGNLSSHGFSAQKQPSVQESASRVSSQEESPDKLSWFQGCASRIPSEDTGPEIHPENMSDLLDRHSSCAGRMHPTDLGSFVSDGDFGSSSPPSGSGNVEGSDGFLSCSFGDLKVDSRSGGEGRGLAPSGDVSVHRFGGVDSDVRDVRQFGAGSGHFGGKDGSMHPSAEDGLDARGVPDLAHADEPPQRSQTRRVGHSSPTRGVRPRSALGIPDQKPVTLMRTRERPQTADLYCASRGERGMENSWSVGDGSFPSVAGAGVEVQSGGGGGSRIAYVSGYSVSTDQAMVTPVVEKVKVESIRPGYHLPSNRPAASDRRRILPPNSATNSSRGGSASFVPQTGHSTHTWSDPRDAEADFNRVMICWNERDVNRLRAGTGTWSESSFLCDAHPQNFSS